MHCPRVLLAAASRAAVAASPLLSLFACSSIRPRQAGGEILQKGLVLPLPGSAYTRDCGSDSTHAAMFKRETQRR